MNEVKFIAEKAGIKYDNISEILNHPLIMESVYRIVNDFNSLEWVNPYEKIDLKAIKLIPKLETGYGLTTTKKVQVREVLRIYNKEVEELSKIVNR
jgi:hypothetical protein